MLFFDERGKDIEEAKISLCLFDINEIWQWRWGRQCERVLEPLGWNIARENSLKLKMGSVSHFQVGRVESFYLPLCCFISGWDRLMMSKGCGKESDKDLAKVSWKFERNSAGSHVIWDFSWISFLITEKGEKGFGSRTLWTVRLMKLRT